MDRISFCGLPKKALPLDDPTKNESESSDPSSIGDAWIRKMSSFGGDASIRLSGVDASDDIHWEGLRFSCILDNMSIFSSFSSSRSFNSRTSDSRDRTLSSNDSVYPRGKALRLSLSLVLHSKPTLAHCEQHGLIPSHLIFLLRQRSQACAMRACELLPTLITFIGKIPGMVSTQPWPSHLKI